MGVIRPYFRLKNFLPRQGTDAKFIDQMPWYFLVGFRWSVGRLKGRSDERRSVALPPLTQPISRRLERLIVDALYAECPK